MLKYVLYARKSTDEEEKQVLSIEAQLDELREFALKEKLEIVASLCEAKTAKEPDKNIVSNFILSQKQTFFIHRIPRPPPLKSVDNLIKMPYNKVSI